MVNNFLCLLLGRCSGAELSQPFRQCGGAGSLPLLQHLGLTPRWRQYRRHFQQFASLFPVPSVFTITLRYYTDEVDVDAKMDKAFLQKQHRKSYTVAGKVKSVTSKTRILGNIWKINRKVEETAKGLTFQVQHTFLF